MNRREFLKKSLEGIVIASIPLISGCGKNPVSSDNDLETKSKIAFSSWEGSCYNLYKMNPDGSNLERLTQSEGNASYPSWSPDGKKIAFNLHKNYKDFIYIMNADGTNKIELCSGEQPAWSPDGSKIAFVNKKDIYVMNPDGSNQINLTNTPDEFENYPTWSPDCKKIAFLCPRGMYKMNPDGSDRITLTQPESSGAELAWSPDGYKIAFRHGFLGHYPAYITPPPPPEIYVFDIHENNLIALTNDNYVDDHPSWSPDGSKIVFHSWRESEMAQIYIMNSDGSGIKRITNRNHGDIEPAWSPFLK